MVSNKYSYLIIIIMCLQKVTRLQVFLSDTNNFQTDLFDLEVGPEQIKIHRVRMDLRVMAMNG